MCPDFKLLQTHSNQNHMKHWQKNNTKINKHLHIWTINLQQRNKYTMEKGQSPINSARKTGQPHAKQTRPLSHHRQKLIRSGLKALRPETIRVLKRKRRWHALSYESPSIFLDVFLSQRKTKT